MRQKEEILEQEWKRKTKQSRVERETETTTSKWFVELELWFHFFLSRGDEFKSWKMPHKIFRRLWRIPWYSCWYYRSVLYGLFSSPLITDCVQVIYEDGDIEDILENDFFEHYIDKSKLNVDTYHLLKKLASNYSRNNKLAQEMADIESSLVSRYVLKEFPGHGMYYGKVESYISPYYKVSLLLFPLPTLQPLIVHKIRYEDNDCEEYTQEELDKYYVSAEKVPIKTKQNLDRLLVPTTTQASSSSSKPKKEKKIHSLDPKRRRAVEEISSSADDDDDDDDDDEDDNRGLTSRPHGGNGENEIEADFDDEGLMNHTRKKRKKRRKELLATDPTRPLHLIKVLKSHNNGTVSMAASSSATTANVGSSHKILQDAPVRIIEKSEGEDPQDEPLQEILLSSPKEGNPASSYGEGVVVMSEALPSSPLKDLLTGSDGTKVLIDHKEENVSIPSTVLHETQVDSHDFDMETNEIVEEPVEKSVTLEHTNAPEVQLEVNLIAPSDSDPGQIIFDSPVQLDTASSDSEDILTSATAYPLETQVESNSDHINSNSHELLASSEDQLATESEEQLELAQPDLPKVNTQDHSFDRDELRENTQDQLSSDQFNSDQLNSDQLNSPSQEQVTSDLQPDSVHVTPSSPETFEYSLVDRSYGTPPPSPLPPQSETKQFDDGADEELIPTGVVESSFKPLTEGSESEPNVPFLESKKKQSEGLGNEPNVPCNTTPSSSKQPSEGPESGPIFSSSKQPSEAESELNVPPITTPSSKQPKSSRKRKSKSPKAPTSPAVVDSTKFIGAFVKKRFSDYGDFYGIIVDFIPPYFQV
jgi:hypothetical protein